jgi:hypothetical protein
MNNFDKAMPARPSATAYRGLKEILFHLCRASAWVLLLPLFFPHRVQAELNVGPVTVGAGIQTSFVNTQPDDAASTNQFLLNSVRLYVNGPVTENIKFMFNTEYDSPTNKIGVLDAAAEISVSSHVNFWAGRFLPPSDRANLYGPYYSNEWAVFTDGIQDGYPFVFDGRDNGMLYWGDFLDKRMKVSLGAFDGKSATGNNDVLGAARVQFDFWDREDGYYLNGTYYGDKNLLAIGGATQIQSGRTATTADFLMERKLRNKGVVTVESEYSNYNGLGGYDPLYTHSQGAYGLGSYLFPKKIGMGQFQLMAKYAKAGFTRGKNASYDQKTTEIDVNYVIKQFNARVMAFCKDTTFNAVKPNFWQAGLGLQFQM